MKSWALVTSLLLAAVAAGQNFGRFGFGRTPIPGFEVDKAGFRVRIPGSLAFRFDAPSTYWKPVATSEFSQTVAISGRGRSPAKLRVDLTAPGFQVYVERGLVLRVASAESPFLTWPEGSVGAGVPTAPAAWAALTFREPQAPLVFGFLSGPASVKVTGRSRDWTIETGDYKGWIRIALPYGTQPRTVRGVAELGAVAKEIAVDQALYTQPSPQVTGVSVEGDGFAVTAAWTFDRPGALVPSMLALAPIANYRLAVQSPTRKLSAVNEEGPMAVAQDTTLKVRFPIRQVPAGRALVKGRPTEPPLASADPYDCPSVAELALSSLMGFCDRQTSDLVRSTQTQFDKGARWWSEVSLARPVPFSADGEQADAVAAHALLFQARECATSLEADENDWLARLSQARDWYSGRLMVGESRRAAACAAVAGAMATDPRTRLQGALFEAGLAAQRGLAIWRQRRTGGAASTFPEPLDDERRALFGYSLTPLRPAFLSPLRIFGEAPAWLEQGSDGLRLAWENEDPGIRCLLVIGPPELDIRPGPTTLISSTMAVDWLRVSETWTSVRGDTYVLLDGVSPTALPAAGAWPRFTEPVR